MNAVFGFTQLLGMDDLTHDQDAAVQQILRGGRHLVARIDDVLDIAKIETDRLDLTLEALLMSELLSDTVALMMPVAKSANIALSFNQTDGANQHVLGDSHHLRQVVLNLLSNAIKIQPARRPGRGPVRTVRTHRCRYRRPRHRHRHPGRGATPPVHPVRPARRPIQHHRRQRSRPSAVPPAHHDHGRLPDRHLRARDRQRLPSLGSAGHTGEPAPGSARPDYTSGHARPHDGGAGATDDLLYIEDNNSNVTLMEQLISHRPQWNMITAGAGNVGLDLAATRLPNLVLLDLHLPDMDGNEVLHRLRADLPTSDLRVVIVSADASPNQMNRLLAVGASAYLTKPLDVARMLDCSTHSSHNPPNSRFDGA